MEDNPYCLGLHRTKEGHQTVGSSGYILRGEVTTPSLTVIVKSPNWPGQEDVVDDALVVVDAFESSVAVTTDEEAAGVELTATTPSVTVVGGPVDVTMDELRGVAKTEVA